MPLGEADTRAKLIDPALHARGWTEDLVRREETAGAIEIVDGRPRRQARGRVDYTLRVKVNPDTQPVAVALIEAKAEHLPPAHGLEQGKLYSALQASERPVRLRLQRTPVRGVRPLHRAHARAARRSPSSPRRPICAPDTSRAWASASESPAARPLLTRYPGGEATRRYYQDAAIRAVLEKLARGEKRALLSLATGSGKTFIAVNLLRRIADAGQLRRALFVCDRDELRTQGLGAFHATPSAPTPPRCPAPIPQKNARILVATYQTLDVDTDEADANFLIRHYPENYFSHIVIDECHRSAWGKWSQVLTRNPERRAGRPHRHAPEARGAPSGAGRRRPIARSAPTTSGTSASRSTSTT